MNSHALRELLNYADMMGDNKRFLLWTCTVIYMRALDEPFRLPFMEALFDIAKNGVSPMDLPRPNSVLEKAVTTLFVAEKIDDETVYRGWRSLDYLNANNWKVPLHADAVRKAFFAVYPDINVALRSPNPNIRRLLRNDVHFQQAIELANIIHEGEE